MTYIMSDPATLKDWVEYFMATSYSELLDKYDGDDKLVCEIIYQRAVFELERYN